MQGLLITETQKSPDPTTREGSEIGGSSFQVVVAGRRQVVTNQAAVVTV